MSAGRYNFAGCEPWHLATRYVCLDCGVVVADQVAHDRYHAIENSWARAIAVLVTTHIAPHVHDRYDVAERIPHNDNNWSSEAFEEVAGVSESREETT